MAASLKQRVVAAARAAGLVPALEAAKFVAAAARAREDNARFLAAHPGFAPPSLWWMHDMYGHASFRQYAESGAATAAALVALVERFGAAGPPRAADWGCGLARVLRHLPPAWERSGFDYNRRAIAWCRDHIAGAVFAENDLMPPLPAEARSFDVVYALSVFTHLSERSHDAWADEIARVLAPGGLFLGAFHMAPPEDQLLPDERRRFEEGRLVTRERVLEGGRTFTAFHPERYLRERLLARFDILDGPLPFFGQHLFVVRKAVGAA